jgi:hypothetical protein
MRKNKFQVVETYISNDDGLMVKAWHVIDSVDGYIVEVFDRKIDATYYAKQWSKQAVN